MRIAHYSLGFPPFRTGGLVKFNIDLMLQQIQEGHEVTLLWPGRIRWLGNKVHFVKHESVKGIKNYEIINALPIPYDEGIKEVDRFIKEGRVSDYKTFLAGLDLDVIHVHTLMGLHKSFLLAAKELGIRLCFTSHDFFPVCPRVTMFRNGKVCDSRFSCEECSSCNDGALSYNKMRLLQSGFYMSIKDNKLIKKLRKSHRSKALQSDKEVKETDITSDEVSKQKYIQLRKHYGSMLLLMDAVHYNSSISKKAYEAFFDLPDSSVISISHRDILDQREKKKYESDYLRIRYLGQQSAAKGFYLLINALDKLWKETHSFQLDVHFPSSITRPYLKIHDRYNYDALAAVLRDTDVLVCPSLWLETFGFTVLEALSYGVPVIISGNVGAKDILHEGAGVILEEIDAEKLYLALKQLKKNDLEMMNKTIVASQSIDTIEKVSERITELIYRG